MPLEKQIVSLELANRLKELEVKQESLFYWTHCPVKEQNGEWTHVVTYGRNNELPETFSAFTVAELGEMLPESFQCWKWARQRTLRQEGGEIIWNCLTDESTTHGNGIVIIANTEANARAKMLIYLLENNLLTN